MRPPRAIYPNGFKVGNSLAKPGMRELQREILRDALGLLTENTRPGEIVSRDYPQYGEYHEPPRVKG
jgi:hypothetical protein